MNRLHIVLMFGVLAMMAPVGEASAQPARAGVAETGDEARTKKARELYVDGMKEFQKSRWAEARVSFLASFSLKKHWQIAASLGDCEMRLRRYREAAEHIAFYAREAPPEKRKEAAEFLRQARAHVGTITVTVDREGAEVLVDGEPVGRSPLTEIYVDPGRRTVAARAAGAESAERAVDAAAGGVYTVVLALGPTKEQEKPRSLPIVEPVRGPSPWLIVGGAAASVVAIGMGIGFTAAANGVSTDAATLRTELVTATPPGSAVCSAAGADRLSKCEELRGKIGDLVTFSDAALGSFVAGGVLTLGTAGLAVWWRTKYSKTPAAGTHVTPVVGTTGGGVHVVGAW